ncbi:MAG: hypothetical protein DRO11_08390 [Methanobacteriota archaeon]|nr:MAG: hypothetical protein DRO11_08390 [Euryarchaeota archaeon]
MTIDYDIVHAEFDAQESELTARQTALLENWRFYEGKHRQWLKVKEGGHNDNVTINLCGVLVDRTVSRLFGDPVRGDLLDFDLVPTEAVSEGEAPTLDQAPAPEKIQEARRYLEQVWERSGGIHTVLSRTGVYGAVTGHFVLRLVADDEIPRFVVLDPGIVSVLVKGDDRDKVRAYSIQFPVKRRDKDGDIRDADFRQLIVYGPEFGGEEGWYIQDFIRFKPKTSPDRLRLLDDEVPRWQPAGDEEIWPFCPLFDGQNLPSARSYWGMADLENVKNINDEINFILSNVNRIIRFHAHPRTIGIGIEPSQVQDTAVEAFWTVATTPDKAEIFNLEMQSDLPAVFNFFQIIREAFWTIGREADPSVFKEKIGNVTNFGLRVLYMDALNKLGQKRQTYGKVLSNLLERCLELKGFNNLRALPNWSDPLPTDPRETVQTLQMERDMQIVSRETAALERGRNWEVEKRRMQEDAQGQSVGKRLLRMLQAGGTDDEESE